MSKSSSKQKIKQLKIWLDQELKFGKGKNNRKSINYVSRKNDKQPVGKNNDGKNNEQTNRISIPESFQKSFSSAEKEGRYRRKFKSYSYSESVYTNNPK